MVFQVSVPTIGVEEAEVDWVYEDLQDFLELTHTHKKRCPFHHRRLKCKSRKSRDTWSNRQVGLGVQNEAGQRLTKFCQENTPVIANTFSNNTRDDSTHGHHQKVNTEVRLIIFFVTEGREALYNQQKQDWELTLAQIISSLWSEHILRYSHAKFYLQLKKVWETNRPFRCDLIKSLRVIQQRW